MFTAGATFALLGAGGLVTSHGVGMAVPDWPNTFGYNMFFFPFSQWVGGVFYEHTHRLLASGVGLCTSIVAIWLFGKNARPFLRWVGLVLLFVGIGTAAAIPAHWRDAAVAGLTGLAAITASLLWPNCEPAEPWLKRLGLAAFFTVVLQGVLGGLRVVLFKDQIGIFHATLAQLFFVLTIAVALFTSPWWQEGIEIKGQKNLFAFLCAGTSSLILIQLILGASMRHQHAGLSIPDFPLAYGKVWPAMDPQSVAHYNQQRVEVVDLNPITSVQILMQMVHRLTALVILAATVICAWFVRRRLAGSVIVSRLAVAWVALIFLQAFLGAATIWSNKAADIATAHVLVGALSLATGVVLTLISSKRTVSERTAVAAPQSDNQLSGSFGAHPAPAGGIQ